MRLLLNLLLLLHYVLSAHEPNGEAPTFMRSAVESNPELSFIRSHVESIPEQEDVLAKITIEEEIGDKFLPLRSAVESIPTVSLTKASILKDEQEKEEVQTKSFIRSSVEYRPISEARPKWHSEKIQVREEDSINYLLKTSDKLQAFIAPSHHRELEASPFRAGSPYQEIVSSEAFEAQVRSQQFAQLRSVNNFMTKNLNPTPEVLCYLTNWGFHRKEDGKFIPEYLQNDLCTTIIYSFASLDPETLTIREFDPWVDVENNFYERATSLKVPVLLAIGGWTDSSGEKYSKLVGSETSRTNFASHLVSFLQKYGFKGIHVDWNYPKCWQSDCAAGPSTDKPNFTKLIRAIRSEFDKHDKSLKIGVALSGYKEIISEAYELTNLSKLANFLTVMTYDYHGAWEQQTGHVSPLYGRNSDKYPQYNTDYAMQFLVKNGATREKLIMGIPFYGQSFTLDNSNNQLVGEGAAANGPGEPGEFTRQPGMMAYYEICHRIRKSKWQMGRDHTHKSGPFAMLRNQWVGYEDPDSVEAKARYAVNNGFGGIAAWTVDLDDFHNRCCSEDFPLLRAVNRALGRLNSQPPRGDNCQRPSEPVTPAAPVMTTISDSGAPGSSQIHEHTTWPSWDSTTSSTTPWWVPPQSELSTQRTSTTSKTTTTTTTTRRPTISSVRPQGTTIPAPSVVMPVTGSSCTDGPQFKADAISCTSYYQCIFGEYRQQHCNGGLHFNKETSHCDWPASAQCQVSNQSNRPTSRPTSATHPPTYATQPSTNRTTTTSRPATTTYRPYTSKKPIVQPSTCTNGEYYPDSECDAFNICVNNQLISQRCAEGLQWNTQTSMCDWKNNVNCLSKKTYLKLIEAKADVNDPCTDNTHLPYPGSCHEFLICNWDRLELSQCAPGLHWNQDLKICDWPDNAKCEPSTGEDETELTHPEIQPPITQKPSTTTTTKRPTYPTNKPILEPYNGYYKMVCYFTNWAWYRQGIAKYTPDDINADLCTHIVYGFAVLDYSELTIRTHDSWADIDNKFYERVTDFKRKGVKVSLALGGWNDSQGDKYSRLVRSASARAKFVKQALEFIERYGFEGLDLDWEYPVCWQTECNKGFPDEKEGFTALVRELSLAFKPRNLLLSTAVSPSKKIIDTGYDVPEISKYFDWIAVMTYDFHGQWDKKTGHVAPLYHHPEDDYDYFNSNFSLNYWIEKGAPSRKIVMGMPLYGQSFSLENTFNNGLNAKAPGPGTAGEFTRAAGFLAYYEICDRIRSQGWSVVQDPKGRMGPYAHKGNQWVSFDDQAMLRKKSQLVRQMNLGGGMVWALDLDDFKNRCGEGVHPLLTAIHDVLKDPPKGNEQFEPSPIEPEPVEIPSNNEHEHIPENIETLPDSPSNQIGEIIDENHAEPIDNAIEENPLEEEQGTQTGEDYKVVCYFTNWAWYRQGGGKFVPEDIDPDLCTHIVYGFAVLDRDQLTIKPHDSWADLDNKFYERVVEFKRKGLKVTMAIGGWNDSAGDKYARLVKSASARARFIRHVTEFIEKYNFDGLDLDWEYPVCWQVDCNKGSPDEKQGFSSLVQELSAVFKQKDLLLSAAVSPNRKVIDAGYDVPNLSHYFDWIAVMAYDYHGQWDKKTGHVAPMYEHPEGTSGFNANFTVNYWIEKGADPKKLVLGMPMYGQSFSLAEGSRNALNSPTYGGGEAGEATRARGFLSYYEICQNIRNKQWTVVRDPRGRIGPYAYKRDQWVSFDDIGMIRHKSEYVKAMGLGGAMIWALDLDDFKNICDCETYPLLKTINRVLRNYKRSERKCKLEDNAELAIEPPKRKTTIAPFTTKSTWNTPQSTQEPVLSGSPSKELMKCDGRNFVSHNEDCNKYYICQHNMLMERK
ncbi:Cht3 family protein [Megaselia abdita]